jgi:hypothetical protein
MHRLSGRCSPDQRFQRASIVDTNGRRQLQLRARPGFASYPGRAASRSPGNSRISKRRWSTQTWVAFVTEISSAPQRAEPRAAMAEPRADSRPHWLKLQCSRLSVSWARNAWGTGGPATTFTPNRQQSRAKQRRQARLGDLPARKRPPMRLTTSRQLSTPCSSATVRACFGRAALAAVRSVASTSRVDASRAVGPPSQPLAPEPNHAVPRVSHPAPKRA